MDALRSSHCDHYLAEGVTLADVGQGVTYVVETERAVNVDADVPCDAQVGERLEPRRSQLSDAGDEAVQVTGRGTPLGCRRAGAAVM